MTLQEIKRAIRDKYAWPGGYPLYLVMSDGECLSISDGHNRCTISFDDYFGQRISYQLYAACNGGYVFDKNYGNDKQICERLSATGATLLSSGKEPLVDAIRREYRRMRAAERRQPKGTDQ